MATICSLPDALKNEEIPSLLPSQTRFGDLLSTEIWTLIFEELHRGNEYFLKRHRLISQRFNTIVTPLAYREFELSKSLIVSRPGPLISRITTLIQAYTRRLSYDQLSELSWYRAVKFIRDCRSLRDIDFIWRFKTVAEETFPPALRDVLEQDMAHLRLHMTACKQRSSPYSIPSKNLVSFSTQFPGWSYDEHNSRDPLTPLRSAQLLQSLLSSAPNLEKLTLQTIITFSAQCGKLPPIKALSIRGSWKYTSEEVSQIWDFSQLKDLTIDKYSIKGITQTIPHQHFYQLSKFKLVKSWYSDLPRGSKVESTSVFTRLKELLASIDKLVELVVCHDNAGEIVPFLSKHGKSLRILRLDTAYGDPPIPININDLMRTRLILPNLTELRLNILFKTIYPEHNVDWELDEPLLSVLSNFRNLLRLEIITQYLMLDHIPAMRSCSDKITTHISSRKVGVPFSWLAVKWPEIHHGYRQCYIEFRRVWHSDGRVEFHEANAPWP